METKVHPILPQFHGFQRAGCRPLQCVKGDPKDTVPVPYHEPCVKATHTVLQVQEPYSTQSMAFRVNFLNGFNGGKITVRMKSSDTIGKLQQKLRKQNPDLGENLNLVYNGKPVEPQQTLSELQVKHGATFITFQKCHGG